MSKRKLPILPELCVAIVSDTEDNHPNYVPGWHRMGSNYDVKHGELKWEWSRYWSDLSECFKSENVPITWLVRVDDGPMRDRMISLFRNEILGLKSKGDEIGIHIHTWIWDLNVSKWVQTKDPEHEAEIVRHCVDMFKTKFGFSPSSVRMGWNTMSNEIMRALDASGLIVDSSAIPGTFCSGKFDKRDNIMDWSRAPSAPYRPSYDDYQSPGDMKILEIPISTLEASKSNLFAPIVTKFSEIGNISSLVKLLPIARRLNLNPNSCFYISPWWSLTKIFNILRAYYKKAYRNEKAFLVGSFHACDILDPRTGGKNLVFEHYLSKIIREISSFSGIHVAFTTLSEIAENY
jgi:hypothetical protein